MSGGFIMAPTIFDGDARNTNGGGCSLRITFEPGHTDDYDRRCFRCAVNVDDDQVATFTIHYEAARELHMAIKAAMKGDKG
jgi:polyferredoxin